MGRIETRVGRLAPGIALCVLVAFAAYFIGRALPIVGGPIVAILLGVAIAALRRPSPALQPGLWFSSKMLLQAAIVLFGATLNLAEVVHTGVSSLAVMIGTMVLTLGAAYALGRLLRIERIMRSLVGVGTAVCGASAIAALSGVIGAEEPSIAYAISTVFLFNVVAVFVFPPLGHLMHLSQHAFGLWAGTAINDTSSVVAAGFSYGGAAAAEAVIVKLTRATLIIPIVLAFAARQVVIERRSGTVVNWRAVTPWFILWFVLASALSTFGVIPVGWHAALGTVASLLIIVALAGVGLCVDFEKMRATGIAPLFLGLLLWLIIASSSLGLARVFGG